jgi:hypothetical protein
VEIVNAVKIHVFGMPGKAAFPHAKVKVCSVDTVNADAIIFIDKVQNRPQFVDIPVK